MAHQYHRNRVGEISVCRATKRQCPLEPVHPNHSDVQVYLAAHEGTTNVALFEDLFIADFLAYSTGSHVTSERLTQIPDRHRPVLFRGLDGKQLQQVCQSLLELISHTLNVEHPVFTRVQNNRVGADFKETITNSDIEVKLGKPTDGNLGVKNLEPVIGKDFVSKIPDPATRKRWKDLYIETRTFTVIDQERRQELEKLQILFNQMPTEVSSAGQKKLDSLYLGNTIQGVEFTNLFRFSFQSDGWVTAKTTVPENMRNAWFRKPALLTDADRLSLYWSNPSLSVSLKAVLHYKNTVRLKTADGGELLVPALKGLGSPCFNIWFTPM